jgi:hypothetical protein
MVNRPTHNFAAQIVSLFFCHPIFLEFGFYPMAVLDPFYFCVRNILQSISDFELQLKSYFRQALSLQVSTVLLLNGLVLLP